MGINKKLVLKCSRHKMKMCFLNFSLILRGRRTNVPSVFSCGMNMQNSIIELNKIDLPTPTHAIPGNFYVEFLTGLNSKFSFSWGGCHNKVKESSQTHYLPIAGGRIILFIPFSRVLMLSEMQIAQSRFWTMITMSITYNDILYTRNASKIEYHIHCIAQYLID